MPGLLLYHHGIQPLADGCRVPQLQRRSVRADRRKGEAQRGLQLQAQD
jgi:hypothetical protein